MNRIECLLEKKNILNKKAPLRGLEGVPGLPGAPQDEAGLTRTFETSHVGGAKIGRASCRERVSVAV